MSLPPGHRIGPYEVVAPLGAGGMGEVYRAKDSKLKREVALKVLPAEVANDQERLARFQREAEVLASLNHPHIAQIFGLEENALVMELVEGEDLAERLKRGAIPIDEALPIAHQIAEALEAAHDAGIVHRDLKPANVKVRPDGTVKVLDFGLAKALDPGTGIREPGSGNSAANSPTITSPAMTMRGVILGTAAYMAPEQAKGRLVDRRADIWAFGCVLYEMLTGQRTFAGGDVSDTLVSILRDDPRWAALPSGTPPHIRLLLRRCLQKDPQKRLPHIGAARIELADTDTGELIRASAPATNIWRIAALGAIAGAALAGAIAYVWLRSPAENPAAPAAIRFTIEAPDQGGFPGASGVPRFAISPDGREIVYQVQDAKGTTVLARSLDATEARPIEGGQGGQSGLSAQQPFWSPDGRYVALFDEVRGRLNKIERATSLSQVITDVPGNQMSGSWNDDDVIIYASATTGGVRRVAAGGAAGGQVTTLDQGKKEIAHLWPDFLPDGRHFVYLAVFAGDQPSALYLGSLDGGPAKRLFESPTMALIGWPDRLLFVRQGKLLSQQIDLQRLELVGEAAIVAESIPATPAGRIGVAAAARANVIAYAEGPEGQMGEVAETFWADRGGRALTPSPPAVVIGSNGVRLSPDGHSLIYSRGSAGRRGEVITDLWIQDVARGIETQLADDATPGVTPVFSPDSSRVVYRLSSNGQSVMRDQPVSGATAGREIYRNDPGQLGVPIAWTHDDQVIFYGGANGASERSLAVLPLTGEARPTPYLPGTFRLGAALSPDGRWMAYTWDGGSDDTQVFIQAFPDPTAGKWPVSGMGAAYPRWRPDGRELYFLDAKRRLMAAPVTTSPKVEVGPAVALFEVSGYRIAGGNPWAYPYDVTPDGKGFVGTRLRGASLPRARLIVHVNALSVGSPNSKASR